MIPRRPIVAVPSMADSKLSAMSLCRASSSIGSRDSAIGMPASSSSPVSMTVMRSPSSAPAACSAFSACIITTTPPFMSAAPVPKARTPSRRNFSPASTVSR